MLTTLRVALARIFGFLRSRQLDRDFEQELEAHLAMAEEDKIRQGMTPQEARRLARVELGGVTQLREAGREARGLPRLDSFWLDLKLSLRMLRKSWGLTLVGGFAMTLAIGIGVIVFWLIEMSFWPVLPLHEGDRVVALQTWDDHQHRRRNTAVQDLERWRDGLRSVEDFGAFESGERSLAVGDGPTSAVQVAEMTASGFQLARVPPLLGRPLVEEDEQAGSPPVAVISHKTWQSKLEGDPAIVGKTVRLGGVEHTVVGVMPRGFIFPVMHHVWTPLRLNPGGFLQDEGPEGVIFARLKPGASLKRAHAELTGLGVLPRAPTGDSAEAAETGERLEPRVVSYAFAFTGDFAAGEVPLFVRIVLGLILLLLVPPCANIAILIYARTITRHEEFAARSALGATRGRIVGQLFIEVLVLASVAAGVALVLANAVGVVVKDLLTDSSTREMPFWMDFTMSYRTVLFAAGLAVIAATIAGIVPALKATGRQMHRGFSALGSRTGMRLGGTWTVLVVTQVALTLAALPSAVEMGWGTLREGVLGPGIAAEEYLTARLEVDRELSAVSWAGDERPFTARFGALQADLLRQLEAEPGVLGATVATAVPGDEPWVLIEVEGEPPPEESEVKPRGIARFNHVDVDFFEVFGTRRVVGRGFEAGDIGPSRNPLIVNQTFVRLHLGEGNPLGRRVRYVRSIEEEPLAASKLETWYEIVGVVADLPANPSRGTIYHPAAPGGQHPASLAVHARLEPVVLADRIRKLTTAQDPALRAEEIFTLDEIYRQQQFGNDVGTISLALITLSVLLLSAAGIYALMSFTINDRRREVGIRSALGASPRRLLFGVFRRALTQVATGAVLGALVALVIDYYLPIEGVGGWNVPGVIPAAALFMAAVCALAAAGPARRGLRVDPIEELREG